MAEPQNPDLEATEKIRNGKFVFFFCFFYLLHVDFFAQLLIKKYAFKTITAVAQVLDNFYRTLFFTKTETV
ncbi:MAG: hypothetical protein C4308_00190 [Chitinophagaceae bacterium]